MGSESDNSARSKSLKVCRKIKVWLQWMQLETITHNEKWGGKLSAGKMQLLLLSEDYLAGGDDQVDHRVHGGDGARLHNIHIH